jgi:peroxiredoxin Q/BCP
MIATARQLCFQENLMRTIGAIAMLLSLAGTASAFEKGDLKVGDEAPAFELKGSDGETYKLSDFKDEKVVVVAWFPKAFTGG